MRILLMLIASCLFSFAYAQEDFEPMELQGDSLSTEVTVDTTHSPTKAALLSLLPGAGQIYNSIAMPKGRKNAYWKVPLIYAGLGVTGYFFFKFNKERKMIKQEYLFRIKNGHPNLSQYEQYDNQGLLEQYKMKRTSRDLMLFAFVAVYGLNILDAYVQAHFIHFDVSKDLSLSIHPKVFNFSSIGLGINLSLH